MKSIMYRNPVISAIFINLITMILFINSINQDNLSFMFTLMLTGILNKNIINNGINLNKQRKEVIYLSFFISIAIFFIYSTYSYKISINEILNK